MFQILDVLNVSSWTCEPEQKVAIVSLNIRNNGIFNIPGLSPIYTLINFLSSCNGNTNRNQDYTF